MPRKRLIWDKGIKREVDMKRLIGFLLLLTCTLGARETIQEYETDSDALYRSENGTDGAYTATSSSMIAWGVALAAGIAILAGCLRQSTASSSQ